MQAENKIELLAACGVVMPRPDLIHIAADVLPERIERGAVLNPGVVIEGKETLLGRGCVLGPGGHFIDVRCGRNVRLFGGYYSDCVFLDGARVRGESEIRSGTLFMEKALAAHNVGCKMTVLGIGVTLGSLINFCDVFVSGGTDKAFDFTEIGSGAVHYNFTPNALKFGSSIGAGAPGEMFGIFPRTFIGGQTQIIAPTTIGCGVLIPAGSTVRNCVPDGVLYSEQPLPALKKPYDFRLISRVREKFELTAKLIAHYQALDIFFQKVRMEFARHAQDPFLRDIYREARKMIELNVKERINWLFAMREDKTAVDLFSRLPLSLELQKERLGGRSPKKAAGELQEHQTLLGKRESLLRLVEKPLDSRMKHSFIKELDFPAGTACGYLEFLHGLSDETKHMGVDWLNGMVEDRVSSVRSLLDQSGENVEIEISKRHMLDLVRPCLGKLEKLYRDDKLLLDGSFAGQDLGVINGNIDDLETIAWRLLSYIDFDKIILFEKVLDSILRISWPIAVKWPDLWSCLASDKETEIEKVVMRSSFRFHGTDGLRGRMVCPGKEFSLRQAIGLFLRSHEVTPELFNALSRNTVYASEKLGNPVRAVAVGKDTRDLYAGDLKHEGIFYRAVVQGLLSTGVLTYDLGTIPIPGVPYFMAHCHTKYYIPPDLAVYKSASHNPASQDGVKTFVRFPGKLGEYRKASQALESAISALLIKEAITRPCLREQGKLTPVFEIARDIFSHAVANDLAGARFDKLSLLVADFAHGALADPAYLKVVALALNGLGPKKLLLVGDAPDGKNINNNEGNDRVGAAHLENVHEIKRQDTEPGGKFAGFPALSALFSFDNTDDDQAWAIFTDGDGDRGYAAFRGLQPDIVHIIDGEQAFFYQVSRAVIQGRLKRGGTLAFTVESSIPFMNALIDCVSTVCPVHFSFDGAESHREKINLKITPVGDKYILASQCPGMESSGHLVASYTLTAKNFPAIEVWAGNGLLSMINTILAFNCLKEQGLPGKGTTDRLKRLQQLVQPYPRPHNKTIYMYFVSRNLWYRNSEIWRELEKIIISGCSPHKLTRIDFPQEPDTLYYVCLSEQGRIRFSILARMSGTENKMSVKLYGTGDTWELFSWLAEELFGRIAPRLKDYELQTCRDQLEILHLLANRDSVPLAELAKRQSFREKTYSMMIVGSLCEQGDRMANYDGVTLKITERGRKFLEISPVQNDIPGENR